MLVSTVMTGKPICRVQRSMMALTVSGSTMDNWSFTALGRGDGAAVSGWPSPPPSFSPGHPCPLLRVPPCWEVLEELQAARL